MGVGVAVGVAVSVAVAGGQEWGMRVFGHGVDIIEVARVGRMRAEHGGRFLERVFTARELEDCAEDSRLDQRLAARFAAKEAAFKALGTGLSCGITWQDVAVHTQASGRPELVISGRAGEIARERGIAGWSVSISHTKVVSVASVLAFGG